MNLKNRRIIALIIDLLIIGSIATLLSNFIKLQNEIGSFDLFGREILYGYSYIFILYLLYFYFFDIFSHGKTLGKALFKVRTISVNDSDFSLSKRIGRSTLKVLNILLALFTVVPFLLKGCTIQDKICGTKTIDDSKAYLA